MILDKISNLIDPLAQILNMDIDIVDTKGIRLQGTGVFKERTGKMSIEQAYSKAVITKNIVIIETPRNSNDCRGCANILQCTKKIIIAMPVYLKGKIVGVIGFLSYNDKVREDILLKLESYLKVFKNISDNVSKMVFQNDYFGIYHELFSQMIDGVIITDEKGIIIDCNRSAHVVFGNIKELVGKKINIKFINTGNYEVQISNIKIKFFGNVHITENEKTYIVINKIEKDEKDENTRLTDGLLIGKSKVVVELKKKFQKVIEKNIPLLIKGDIGTDKEMFAKWIHNSSERFNAKYISINCRDEEEDNLEEKLFGNDVEENLQVGILESADGGTVFIDEIELLSASLQKKILYFLNTGKVKPVNSENELLLDVRIITSTKTELLDMVRKNLFNENLYYKLDGTNIEIPSLKYRKDDLEEIIEYLLNKHSYSLNKGEIRIDEKAKKTLIEYEWSGNWKELEGVIKLLVEFAEEDNIIGYESIPEKIKVHYGDYDKKNRKIRKIMELECDEIVAALMQYGNDTEGKKIVAKKLGIGIATLYRKIENYQIDIKK